MEETFQDWIRQNYGGGCYDECKRRVDEEGAEWTTTLLNDVLNEIFKDSIAASRKLGMTRTGVNCC